MATSPALQAGRQPPPAPPGKQPRAVPPNHRPGERSVDPSRSALRTPGRPTGPSQEGPVPGWPGWVIGAGAWACFAHIEVRRPVRHSGGSITGA